MARTVQLLRHDAYCPVLTVLLRLKSGQLIANQISEFVIVMIIIITTMMMRRRIIIIGINVHWNSVSVTSETEEKRALNVRVKGARYNVVEWRGVV